jgi:hypothetical protein
LRGGFVNGTPLGDIDFEEHGTGWKALISMVLVQAIIEADKGSEEAETWLMGAGGENCLQFLDIPVTYLSKRKKNHRQRMPPHPPKRGKGKAKK